MKIIRHHDIFRQNHAQYNNIPDIAKNCVLALGNFDGVHKGHQILLQKAIEIAKNLNVPSAILTFEPHPVTVLIKQAENLRITNFQQKFRLIEQIGIEYLFNVHFNSEFSQLSAHDFVTEILVKHLKVKHIIIGDDFIFGHKREGNIQLLREMSKIHNFEITQMQTINSEGESLRISSSAIRQFIKAGEMQQAAQLMGHNFTIEGRVIKGQQKGRLINVPTANIELKNYLRPRFGVYQAQVKIHDRWHHAICNIGNKPTISNNKQDLLEVHIFDFNRDIYQQKIQIKLLDFIRDEQKFDSFNQLKQQIHCDIEQVKTMFTII